MSLLGKLIAAPARLVNVPIRVIEKVVDPDDNPEDRFLSVPLEAIAKALEEVVDGEDMK